MVSRLDGTTASSELSIPMGLLMLSRILANPQPPVTDLGYREPTPFPAAYTFLLIFEILICELADVIAFYFWHCDGVPSVGGFVKQARHWIHD